MLPSLSTEVSSRLHHGCLPFKPQSPPILPPISTITTLLPADVTSQAHIPCFPFTSPYHFSNEPWKREDDVNSLDSKKSPLAVTPLIVAITEISSSFIKTKPKKKRRNAEQIDRKFPCNYSGCPKSYGSEGALKNHKRLKHPDLPFNQVSLQPTTPTALQQVHTVQIHPSQLLHHNANRDSTVQVLPSPQVLYQQTSNTVA